MKVLKLIQIGDIHYPDFRHAAVVDRKDEGVPLPFVEAVSADKLQNVARHLLKVTADEHVASFLICGDLTSRGHLAGYKDCLEYLDQLLQLRDVAKLSNDRVHAVPGNHDVDRNLCKPGLDLYKKFEPLERSWEALNRNVLAARALRQTQLEESGCRLSIFSLNSCIGCGELRSLPQKLGAQLHAVFDEYSATNGWEQAFALLGEQLDTPAFVESHMTSLVEQIGKLDAKSLPIVLAHHNILPQAIPRIDIYTEVINGGLVRSRLVECRGPVIYCHGHIHSDPVEVIGSPRRDCGPLISTAAPMFGEGFNVIELAYGQKEFPLGCTVTAHRIREDGGVAVDKTKTVRIPLRPTSEYLRCGDDRLSEFVSHVKAGEFNRLSDILARLRAALGSDVRERTLADVLGEAEWFQLVRILDREREAKYWQVMKLVP